MAFRFAIVLLIAALSTASVQAQTRPVIAPGSYVGDLACAACHRDQASTFARTAHHLTSQVASKDTIAGSFSGAAAIMKTLNPRLFFRMEARRDGFYQTAVIGDPPNTTSRSERIEIVTGSGRKGQTYLYWKDDALRQLPVSFWIDPGHWINSPGFGDGGVNFDRGVQPRCLECHATYFQVLAEPNRYDRTNFVLGVGCEKCHGPGGDHIARHQPNTKGLPKSGGIVNTGTMSRDRQIELCAMCHGGSSVSTRAPAFSYRPGEKLSAYFDVMAGRPESSSSTPEVHGNQVGLLKNSRCYQASQMTCSTCHDVHAPQRDIATLSSRCLTCHKMQACRLFPRSGRTIVGKCVDCHMPNQPSGMLGMTTNGVRIQPMVRNHWIKVYPAAQAR